MAIRSDNAQDGRTRGKAAATTLPAIPVVDVGPDWPFETLEHELDRINALLDAGSGRIPSLAIKLADAVSRRWLERWHEPYLEEIDRIAERIARPGAYFLNISYEWGCTSSAGPSPDERSARLVRVLDWPDRGLGRYVMAARVACDAGTWLTLTWPGYTGVLQAVAPGRFAAALNQAPMDQPVGVLPADWVVNRWRVWKQPHLTPAHLLRQVLRPALSPRPRRCLLKRRSPWRRSTFSQVSRRATRVSSSGCRKRLMSSMVPHVRRMPGRRPPGPAGLVGRKISNDYRA